MISKQWTAHTYQNNEIRKYGFKNVLNTLLLTVHLPDQIENTSSSCSATSGLL
jgi:hypothetical protein